MRLFYAIDFPAHIKESLTENLTGIKKYVPKGSFTDKDNFHITLVFLGECEPDKLAGLKKAADNTVAKLNLPQTKIKAVINNLETFGRTGDEILWAGVKTQPEDILQKINKTLLEELELCGIKINDSGKRFTPHVTIARRVEFRNISSKDLQQIEFTPISFEIDSITLMQSVRYAKLIYEPVYERKF